jgi:hypothetical protein
MADLPASSQDEVITTTATTEPYLLCLPQRAWCVPILYRGSRHQDTEQQTEGADRDMAFPAVDFLPASKPLLAAPTVSAARTEAESMIAADGTAARPSRSRTRSRTPSYGAVPLRLLYLIFVRLLGGLRLLARSSASKSPYFTEPTPNPALTGPTGQYSPR